MRIVILGKLFKFRENFLLSARKINGGFHRKFDKHIPQCAPTQRGHSFPAQTHLSPRLAPGWDLHAATPAIDGGHFNIPAKSGRGHGHRNATKQIVAFAFKQIMGSHLDKHVEIASGPSTHSGLALAAMANAGARFDTGGHVYREAAFLLNTPLPAAGRARVFNDLTQARTCGTRALQHHIPTFGAHLSHARAGGACGGRHPAFRARTLTNTTRHSRGDLDGFLQAVEGILQTDAQVVSQIRTTGCALAATATTPAHNIPKEIIEHIGEGTPEIPLAKPAAPGTGTGAMPPLKCRMTEAIIGSLFLGIFKDIIGFIDFLKLRLGIRVVGITIRVQLLCLAAVRLFSSSAEAPLAAPRVS